MKFGDFSLLEMVKNEKKAMHWAGEVAADIEARVAGAKASVRRGDRMVVVDVVASVEHYGIIESIAARYRTLMEPEDFMLSFDSSSGKLYIKSVHTIRVKPQRYVYHFTKPGSADSILKSGLRPSPSSSSATWSENKTLEYPPAVFAINGPFEMWSAGSILRIDTHKARCKWWKDLNFDAGPAIMTFDPIPADCIEDVTGIYSKIRSSAIEQRDAEKASRTESDQAARKAAREAVYRGDLEALDRSGIDASAIAKQVGDCGRPEVAKWFASRYGERSVQVAANSAAEAGDSNMLSLLKSICPSVDLQKAEAWAKYSKRPSK